MATKTISLELDAYEKLAAAKTGPRDSFSQVIRRTHFERERPSGPALLEHLDKFFTRFPDDGISLDEALAELPDDPPVTANPWDDVERGSDAKR